MADNKINVGGRLHSIATGNILAGADEILDDNKGKKQSEVNIDIDNALEDRYTKEQTYSKSELNNMITTPNQEYVSVTANSQTTAVTDVLPATGEADTVYRVGNWDGSQFDASVYSEYAWNGSQYIHLSTKTQIGEVFDISAYNATGGTLAKYADLTAALDGGNNIPQSLRKGGMSIKFVQSSDNKYIRCNLLADSFTTDTTQWAIADDGVYIENPEFVYAKTDSDGKILYGVKTNGEFYFGAGCPQQVKDYVSEAIAGLDKYDDIVSFLDGLLNGPKLSMLLNAKVNAIEGKSLIDRDIAERVDYEENEDYIDVLSDNENKVISSRDKNGVLHEYVGIVSPSGTFDDLVVNGENVLNEIHNTQHIVSGLDVVTLYAYAEGEADDDSTHFYGWKNGKCAWQRAIDAADGIHKTLVFCKGVINVTSKSQFTLQPNGFYNVLYIPHDKSNIELIGEGINKTILNVILPDNFDDIGHYQPMDILGNNSVMQNMAIYSKNARYCIHLDPSVSRQADYHNVTLRDVLLRRLAGEIQQFLTPLGLGIGDGMKLTLERCTLIADTEGITPLYVHDNEDFDSNFIYTIKDCTLICANSSTPSNIMEMNPLGSKNTGNIVFEDNDISSLKPFFFCIPKNRNSKQSLNDFVAYQRFVIKGYSDEPIGYVCPKYSNVPYVLKITSKTHGNNSSVRFDKTSSAFNDIIKGLYATDYTDIYGVVHDGGYQYKDGADILHGYAMGEASIDSGKQSSLQNRIGDCSLSTKTLGVTIDGIDYEITFNQDYTSYTDEQMLTVFSDVVGSVADVSLYYWSADYFPELQPSLITRKNTSEEAILCGMGVHFIGSGMIKATTDSEVDGIAIEDITPGYFGRVVKKAMLAVSQSDHHHICFDLVPSASVDLQNYGIGNTAGVFTQKDNGILKYEGYKGYLTINI